MTSEIRANTLKNRVGLGTVSFTNTGAIVSGIVTANSFSGSIVGDVTGAASQITVADESSDTTCNPVFVTSASGNLEPKTGTNLVFNSASGNLRTGSLFLGQTTNESKTQDGLILERNSVDGEVHITAGRSGGNYNGFQFHIAGASGVTKRLQMSYDGLLRYYAADGSTERLRIKSDGNIGIGGNTNPTNVLHIKTAVNNTAVVTIESTATDSYPFLRLKNDAREYQLTCHGSLGDAFTIYDGTAGSHRFLVTSAGRVLIGTTAEGHGNADDLTIATAGSSLGHTGITIRSGTSSDGNIFFSDATSGSGETIGGIKYKHGGAGSNPETLNFIANGLTRATVGSTYIYVDDGTNGRVTLQPESTNVNQILSTTTGFGSYCNLKYQAADHIFLYGGTERFRITNGGKIGIGHHIANQITKELTIRPADGGGILMGRPGDTVAPINVALQITTRTSGSEAYHTEYHTSNCNAMFTTHEGGGTGGNIIFQTGVGTGNDVERLRISSGGHIIRTGGVTELRGGRTYSTNSNSTWTTMLTFSDANNNGFALEVAVAENNYTTMYKVAGAPKWNTAYFTNQLAGDSNHLHSKDITWRVLNDSGTKRLQFKAVSYTTTRYLTVISVWCNSGSVTWS